MRIYAALLVFVPACFTSSSKNGDMTGALMTGAITAPVHAEPDISLAMTEPDPGRPNGVELRGYLATELESPAIPNSGGFAVRQLGGGVQTSLQTGWAIAQPVGGATLFGRLAFDVISWTKVGEETTMAAFSPTAEIGVAPWGHGLCFAGSATWDVQFNQPDRGIIGIYAGLCGGALDR